jgi:hypothetical protein
LAARERIAAEQTGDAGVKLCRRTLGVFVGTGDELTPAAPSAPQHWATGKAVQDVALSSASVAPHADAVRWIQQVTRLSDGKIAALLNVKQRQTVLNWKAGKSIEVTNLRQLMETKDVLARAQRWHSHPNELVAWLHTPDPDHGVSPAKLLSQGDFDRARFLAVLAPSMVEPTPTWAKRPVPAAWRGALEEPDRPGEFVEDSS